MNADEHVDDVVDFDGRRVHSPESLFANFGEMTLNRIKAIANEVFRVGVVGSDCYWLLHNFLSGIGWLLMITINMTAKWLFVPRWQRLEIGAVFKELNDCLLDVCKRKEVFYTHSFFYVTKFACFPKCR